MPSGLLGKQRCSEEGTLVTLGTGEMSAPQKLQGYHSGPVRPVPFLSEECLPFYFQAPFPTFTLLPIGVYVLRGSWPRGMRVVGGEGFPIPSTGSPLVALGNAGGPAAGSALAGSEAGWLNLGGLLVPLFC